MTTNPPPPSWSSQLFQLVFPGAADAENHLEACKDKDSNPIGHLALAALAYIPFIGDRAINFAERHLEGLSSIPRELSSRIDFILKTAAVIDSLKDQPLLESDPSTPEITLQSINAELETILQKQGVIISPKGESEEPLERTTLLLNQMANLIETSQDSKTLKTLKNDLDTILAKLPKAEITPTSIETIRNSSPIAVQAHAKSSNHPQFIFMQKIYGDNEIFQTNSNRIIAAAKEMIKKSHNSGELSKLFDDLWVKLPKLRSTVAKSQKAQDPKSFGKPREPADFLITPLSFTRGATVYQEYGKWFASKILERFPFPKDRITLKDTRGPLECK
ncbi:MAG: hypothetical protein JSS09_05415, partial [Verrucomicrobia bacterium]|nr:hypothetical protein [Verrucomicrobiota bacterium]